MDKLNFTKKAIAELEPEPNKRYFVYDSKCRGLALQVTSAGAKSYYLLRKIRGSQTEKIRIGSCETWTIEQARNEAERLNHAIADGINPAEVKRTAKKKAPALEMRFGDLYKLYLENYAKLRTKTWSELIDSHRRYISNHWDRKKVSEIQRFEVQSWVNELGADGKHHTANRSFDTFRAILNWGVKHELVVLTGNPVSHIDTFKVKARERFLQPGDEFIRVMAAINTYPEQSLRDFFLMCLATGARRNNVLSMRWNDIKWDVQLWCIPDTKNDEAQNVPLTDQAVGILQRRYDNRSKLYSRYGEERVDQYVFPSDGKKQGHLVSPKSAWQKILKTAGVEDLRIHDLRRTVGSYMAIQGVSSTIIGKALGHRSAASTAIYTKLTQDPIRAALHKGMMLPELVSTTRSESATSTPVVKLKGPKESKKGVQRESRGLARGPNQSAVHDSD